MYPVAFYVAYKFLLVIYSDIQPLALQCINSCEYFYSVSMMHAERSWELVTLKLGIKDWGLETFLHKGQIDPPMHVYGKNNDMSIYQELSEADVSYFAHIL